MSAVAKKLKSEAKQASEDDDVEEEAVNVIIAAIKKQQDKKDNAVERQVSKASASSVTVDESKNKIHSILNRIKKGGKS